MGTFEQRIQHDACSGDYCDPPLRGGVKITHSGTNCTGGFIAQSRVDDKLYQFTAGHCLLGRSDNWHTDFVDGSQHNIGKRHNWHVGTGGDVGILKINNPTGWDLPENFVYVQASSDTTPNEEYAITSTTTSSIGDRVCLTGATTGTDCGEVTALGVTHTVAGTTVTNSGQASYCRAGGDSGAPIYAGHKAFGIHSDSGGSNCSGIYIGINGSQNLMNVDVLTD